MKPLTLSIVLLILPIMLWGQSSNPDLKVKVSVQPKYPQEALITGLEGIVSVELEVDRTGAVIKAEVMDGPASTCPMVTRPDVIAMRAAALKAAKATQFFPVIYDGQPTESQTFLHFTFTDPSPKEEKGPRPDGYRMTGMALPDFLRKEPEASKATRNTPIISGGVLRGSPSSMPVPQYPPAAKAVKASGEVRIKVLVDTNGTILSAEALTGHPLLRGSARMAACRARFAPSLLSGQPAMISGVITYNFVDP